METLIHEDDTQRVYETTSKGWPDEAGSTRTVRTEWKAGHEPAPEPPPVTISPDALSSLREQLATATGVPALKRVLSAFFDALGG